MTVVLSDAPDVVENDVKVRDRVTTEKPQSEETTTTFVPPPFDCDFNFQNRPVLRGAEGTRHHGDARSLRRRREHRDLQEEGVQTHPTALRHQGVRLQQRQRQRQRRQVV